MTRVEQGMKLTSTQKAIYNSYDRIGVLTKEEQEKMRIEIERKLNESNN